jgi:hypothetical protein
MRGKLRGIDHNLRGKEKALVFVEPKNTYAGLTG